MNLQRKIEVIAGAVVLVAALVFLVGYIRERENRAAFAAKAEVLEKSAAESEKRIGQLESDLHQRLDALERQKQQIVVQPQTAPTVIRELVPMQSPIQQTAPITKATLPDAPVAQLTLRQEQELAAFAVSCKQCEAERDSLKAEASEKDKIIAAKTQEVKAAKVAIKGGSTRQRFVTAAKWIVLGIGAGYALHR